MRAFARRTNRALRLLGLLFLPLTMSVPAVATDYALVIAGRDDHTGEEAKKKEAAFDAEAKQFADTLVASSIGRVKVRTVYSKEVSFTTVMDSLNPSKPWLKPFKRTKDRLILYYTGHGGLDVPALLLSPNPKDRITLEKLSERLMDIGGAHVWSVFDMCMPTDPGDANAGRMLFSKLSQGSTFFANESGATHSGFTARLCQAMKAGACDQEELFRRCEAVSPSGLPLVSPEAGSGEASSVPGSKRSDSKPSETGAQPLVVFGIKAHESSSCSFIVRNLNEEDVQAHLEKGVRLYRDGRRDEAELEFAQVPIRSSYRVRASVYLKSGNWQKEIEVLEHAQSVLGKIEDDHLNNLGFAYHRRARSTKDVSERRTFLGKADEVFKKIPAEHRIAAYNRGLVYEDLAAIESDPKTAANHIDRARGFYSDAYDELRPDVDVANNWALLEQERDPKHAEELFQRGEEASPTQEVIRYNHANFLWRVMVRREPQNAEALRKRAKALYQQCPSLPEAFGNLAVMIVEWAQEGDAYDPEKIKEAASILDQGTKNFPGYQQGWYNLGRFYQLNRYWGKESDEARKSRKKTAENGLKRAIELSPQDPSALYVFAQLLVRDKEAPTEALPILRNLVEIDPAGLAWKRNIRSAGTHGFLSEAHAALSEKGDSWAEALVALFWCEERHLRDFFGGAAHSTLDAGRPELAKRLGEVAKSLGYDDDKFLSELGASSVAAPSKSSGDHLKQSRQYLDQGNLPFAEAELVLAVAYAPEGDYKPIVEYVEFIAKQAGRMGEAKTIATELKRLKVVAPNLYRDVGIDP